MTYDHYAIARTVAANLENEGHGEWAEKLRTVVSEGSTGTEIFMGLRWHLQQLMDSSIAMSAGTRNLVDELVRELNAALS